MSELDIRPPRISIEKAIIARHNPYANELYDATEEFRGLPSVVFGPASRPEVKRAAYVMGCYFRREFRYDFPAFDPHDQHSYRAYLWGYPEFCRGREVLEVIGACQFLAGRELDPPASYGWQLAWAWFHPFRRRSGLLSGSWPYLMHRHGRFGIGGPVSSAMLCFLLRMNFEPANLTRAEMVETLDKRREMTTDPNRNGHYIGKYT